MRSTIALALGAALALLPPELAAQGIDLELSPFAGGAFFLQDGPAGVALEGSPAVPPIVEGARFEDTWGAGATAGVRFNDWLAVEGLLTWVPTWLIGTNFSDGTDVYAYMYGLNGVLHLPLRGPLQPFAGLGVGGATHDYSGSIRSHTSRMATLVGGVSYHLDEGRSIRIQARDFVTPFDDAVPGARGGWQHDRMAARHHAHGRRELARAARRPAVAEARPRHPRLRPEAAAEVGPVRSLSRSPADGSPPAPADRTRTSLPGRRARRTARCRPGR
jgi:opacity protein-like surface antigen